MNRDELTEDEASRLASIHGQWQAARAAGAFARADALRSYLMAAGCIGADLAKWRPVFESPAHRRRRLSERIRVRMK